MKARLLAVALVVGAAAARADYWCEKGYHDTAPADRATATHALETIRAALPATPQGWVLQGDDTISVMQNLCGDFDGLAWQYSFNREYQRVDDREARDALMNQAGEVMKADQAAKQAQLDALTKKMEALGAETAVAAQAGDFAKVDALSQQGADLGEQYQQLVDGGSAREKADALMAQASRDQIMNINVGVNGRFVPPDGAVAYPSPAGAGPAYRWSDTRDMVSEDHVVVLFGRPPPNDAVIDAPATARALVIEITADPDRIDATVGSIDFAALGGVVQ